MVLHTWECTNEQLRLNHHPVFGASAATAAAGINYLPRELIHAQRDDEALRLRDVLVQGCAGQLQPIAAQSDPDEKVRAAHAINAPTNE